MTFQDTMQKVLEGRRYDEIMNRAIDFKRFFTSVITRILEWLADHLNLPQISPSKNDIDVLRLVFMFVGVLLVFSVCLFLYLRYIKRKKQTNSIDEIVEQLKRKALTFEDLLNKSLQFANVGNLREAIRYRYIAILWKLNTKNLVNLDNSKTNGQLKRELNANANQFNQQFAYAVSMFNYAYFGHKNVEPSAFDEYVLQVDAFIKEVSTYEKQAV